MKKILSRYTIGVPLASIVTIGLTLSMANMIATEFVVSDTFEISDFSINSGVEDIVILSAIKEPKLLDEVDVPPAPPIVDKTATSSVVVEPVIVERKLRNFNPDEFEITTIAMIPGDSDEQPLVRVPPIMPSRANTSGYCDVRFNVNAQGAPYQVEATYCTQSLFQRSTIRSVAKWKYRPKFKNGVAVPRLGVTNRVRYRLSDERGNIITM